MDINKVILIGRLVRDPEFRTIEHNNTEVPLTRMRIAVNRKPSPSGKQQADFIDLVAWRHLAELCHRHLSKGMRIAIEGAIRQRSWQDNDGAYQSRVEVEVQNIQFLDPRRQSQESGDVIPDDVFKPFDDIVEQDVGDEESELEEFTFSDENEGEVGE